MSSLFGDPLRRNKQPQLQQQQEQEQQYLPQRPSPRDTQSGSVELLPPAASGTGSTTDPGQVG